MKGDFRKRQSSKVLKVNETGWIERNPVSFFLIVFSLLLIYFYYVLHTELFNEYVFLKLIHLNTQLSSYLLNLMGQQTGYEASTIFSTGASVSVLRGCDGLEPMALFVAAILAFPSTIKQKATGIFLGILFLFIINIIRIASLFLLQRYQPDLFELFHSLIWQILFILLSISCCAFWIKSTLTKS